MFKKGAGISDAVTAKNADTIIGKAIHLENVSIKGLGNIYVEGVISGQVDLEGHLSIGTGGKVEGNVKAASATISGTYKGDIVISDTLYITSQAHVFGRLQAAKLIADSGASIAAACFVDADGRVVMEKVHRDEATGEDKGQNADNDNGELAIFTQNDESDTGE
jgi:cytoskeletal protein CcmA (bactofilin family)